MISADWKGKEMAKELVAYFSATGTTKRAAERLAKAVGADLYEIKPAVPYSAADLNWHDGRSRSSVEMNDGASRPELADTDAKIKNYDTIFLGFPIWWYVAPRIISSFLEAYDFSGKRIVLFATSGGSGFGKAAAELKRSVDSSAEVIEGRLLNGISDAELASWAKAF